ncbi:MAG: PLP-dependent aminotransferase family protein [Janthinobacterium lividum]
MQAIVDALSHAVRDGLLRPGERIASVRRAAAERGVSKNTVAEAYDRLVAHGVLRARPGSGYVVAATTLSVAAPARAHVAEALDLVSLLREQLDGRHEVRPGDGRPPPGWMEGTDLGVRLARTGLPVGSSGREHGYGSSWGFLPLRERICLSLSERAIRCDPSQVLLTQGANHALDLITRHLLDPGDTVLVDDPGYYPLFGKLRLAKARVVGVRRLPDGPDLDALQAMLAAGVRPKVFFTQSLAHNPTGGSLSLPVAHGLLQLAERYGFLLVEDDAFADLLPPSRPRLATLDQLNRVLYVGTFSKTLSASLRVGFVAANARLAAALADIKLLTVVATSDHVERFVTGLIASGHYLRHLRRMRGRVEAATTRAVADLGRIGLQVARPRDDGFYLWATLPAGLEEASLCRKASEAGIFLAPGTVFRIERVEEAAALRINVAYASHPAFLTFLEQALAIRM